MSVNCQQREQQEIANKHTVGLSEIRNAGSNRTTTITLCQKEKDLACMRRKIESCQSCVAMLGAGLWGHVVLCSYVP